MLSTLPLIAGKYVKGLSFIEENKEKLGSWEETKEEKGEKVSRRVEGQRDRKETTDAKMKGGEN